MNHCSVCGTQIDPVSGYTCEHCDGQFCGDHRLPEKHNCFAAKGTATLGPDLTGDGVTIGDAETEDSEEEASESVEKPSPRPEDFGRQTECDRCGRPIPEGNDHCDRCERDLQNRGDEHSLCKECGEPIDFVSGYSCKRCNSYFCSDHRLPENHICTTVSSSAEGGKLDLVLGIGLLPALLLWKVASASLSAIMLLFDVRVFLAILVIVPVALFGGVGTGILTTDDVSGTPAEGIVSWAEDSAEDYEESRELDTAEVERLIHQEVNDRRAEHGLAELHYHEGLDDDSRRHSEDMIRRGFFAHENPDGEGPQERTTTRCGVGENIAMSYWRERITQNGKTMRIDSEEKLAESVVDGWMNSPGHRENILDERYASEGIGVAIDEESDEVFITQMFCL